ncbi:YtfJ family protein [Sodalis endosymbiont of Spalangia cameroni]|uniref:YtfJ family protein n=1 Tax=Sodalis praecaptivus TaxID=1239307 RepID=UPI0031F7EF27
MRYLIGLPLCCLVVSLSLHAHLLRTGEPVPPVKVMHQGEVIYDHYEFSHQSWNSARLPGKIRLIQHIAARTSAREMNAALIETLRKARLPREYYQTTTIVDRGDAFFATGWFIRHQIEASLRRYPWSQIIDDTNSVVRHAWQLKSKTSTIVLLNARGEVQWAKEGPLTLEEIRQVVSRIQRLLREQDR